ncbi:MAG: hypothetical protein ACYDBP_07270 [Leptospirales bacterium]
MRKLLGSILAVSVLASMSACAPGVFVVGHPTNKIYMSKVINIPVLRVENLETGLDPDSLNENVQSELENAGFSSKSGSKLAKGKLILKKDEKDSFSGYVYKESISVKSTPLFFKNGTYLQLVLQGALVDSQSLRETEKALDKDLDTVAAIVEGAIR